MEMARNEDIQFWIETKDEKGKITIFIVKSLFIEFLEKRNYKKLVQNKDFQLIKIKENSIIAIVKEHSIREEVKKHLYEISKKDVWEEFLRSDYLSKKFIEGIDSIEINFDYGTQDTAVFFFKNGMLNVTANQIYTTPYNEYDGYVWEDQILKHDFIHTDSSDCEFRQFCWNISGQKEDRLLALETLIGYLLHTYKDAALTKAVIMIDENIDLENNKSEGGTGKSLVATAISKLVPSLKKNGKLLKANDKFFFADVEPHHKVIVFDDVKIDFSFETLYSMITGDIPIEKKYKNPTVVDFKDVPKVMITSNYIVSGTGGSSERRRKIVFEVNSHYRENSPLIEFGHRLFDDWTMEEWQKFYDYMIYCVRQFLTHGLIEAPSINENKNRLIQDTDTDFVCFMDTILENPKNYGGQPKDTMLRFNKSTILQKFKYENPEKEELISPNKFKKWIDIYTENKGITAEHQKSDGKAYVILHNIVNIAEEQIT